MSGLMSSVNLIAGAGILGNIGGVTLAANAAVVSNIASYNALGFVVQFANVVATGSSVLSSGTMTSLKNFAGNTFPAITNAVPTAYIGSLGNTPLGGFTGIILTQVNNIMDNGDLGKFEQVFGSAEGFVMSSNQIINSVVNANNSSSNATYSTQDNIATGGLSQISQAFELFGAELVALGSSVNLTDLSNLGSPQALLTQVYSATTGSAELDAALLAAGVSEDSLTNISNAVMSDEQQKIAYTVMTTITGNTLNQILKLLDVTTLGMTAMSDLLNPVKMFPLTFNTLTAPTVNGLRGIYINSSGAVNSNLETQLPPSVLSPLQGNQITRNTYEQLKKIIPADQALANKALQAGLEQVKAIFDSTTPTLGVAINGLESNKGLNLINSLTTPIPTAVKNFYEQTYTTGTGENGTLLLVDIIGSAAGWVINDSMSNAVSVLSSLSAAGALSTLTNGTNGLFTVMQNAIDGIYGVPDGIGNVMTIPGGLPGAGIYNTYDESFLGPGSPGPGLLPAGYSLIANIIANNSSSTSTANTDWSNMAAQIAGEITIFPKAGGSFEDLTSGLVPNSLVNGLPYYGLDTAVGGTAWFFESIANVSTQGGQAVISTMREARNQLKLQLARIQTDIVVDNVVPEPQATLSSGQYTVSEAVAQKII